MVNGSGTAPDEDGLCSFSRSPSGQVASASRGCRWQSPRDSPEGASFSGGPVTKNATPQSPFQPLPCLPTPAKPTSRYAADLRAGRACYRDLCGLLLENKEAELCDGWEINWLSRGLVLPSFLGGGPLHCGIIWGALSSAAMLQAPQPVLGSGAGYTVPQASVIWRDWSPPSAPTAAGMTEAELQLCPKPLCLTLS